MTPGTPSAEKSAAAQSEYDALTDLFLSGPLPMTRGPAEAPNGAEVASGQVSEPPLARIGVSSVADPGVNGRERAAHSVPEMAIEGMVLGHLPTTAMTWPTQYAKTIADQSRRPVGMVRLVAGEVWVDLVIPRGVESPVRSRVGGMGAGGGNLEHALAEAAEQVGHWVVRVDEVSENDLVRTRGLTGIVLLTGADPAAVVASFRMVRGMCEGLRGEIPPIRLAVMGADDAAAARAEAQIVETVQTHLGREIAVGPRVAKVGAGSTVTIHRSVGTLSAPDLVAMIVAACARRAKRARVVVEPKHEPGGPWPSPAGEGKGRVPLGAIATLLGLKPVEHACHLAPRVLVALAEDGGLHLVADGVGAERELLAAASWVDQNASLLAAALRDVPNLRLDAPTLHVVSLDARACRTLLDTGVRAHLAVQAGGTWVVSPLN